MPYKQIHNPTQGIITSDSPLALEKPNGIGVRATPFCKGVRMRDGEVFSEQGTTAFPTASTTATNRLHGSFMKFFLFVKEAGTTNAIALTTTNAYEYNQSTDTWDCITRGTLIDDCEAAWTASANVTATNDTGTKLRGSNSVKLAVGAAFTTGVAGYRNFASTDFTGHTALHFWIYSSIALAANDYVVRVSEQNAGGTGGQYEDFNIPAIAASTWTPCCIDGDFSDLNAVLSISVVISVDKGAMNLFIDDIRAVNRFTGDEDNQFSVAVLSDTFICTNGIDQPQKYTGTPATGFQNLATALAAGSISTSEIVLSFKDHLIFMNNTENGADAPQRVSWGNIGAIEDYVNGTAGYQDLTGDADWIISARVLGDDIAIIYKERSIVKMEWVNGQTPFRFTIMHVGDGAIGKDAVDDTGGEHVVIGERFAYAYVGTEEIARFDADFGHTMYGLIDATYQNRVFVLYNKLDDEIQIWLPTATAYPDDVWTMNTITKAWYRRVKTALGFGEYVSQFSLTIGDLPGSIGGLSGTIGDFLTNANDPLVLIGGNDGQVLKLDNLVVDNNGSAITNEFQTPDFINPEETTLSKRSDGFEEFFRVSQFIFEAKGDSITTEWSDDSGASWNPTATPGNNVTSLNSTYDIYQQDFDAVVRKIRYRFYNSTVSSSFYLRYYGFKWISRSTRK